MTRYKWRPVWEDGNDFTQEQLDDLAYYLHPGNDVEVHCKHVTIDPDGNPYLLDDWGNWYDLRRMDVDELRIAWEGHYQ